MIGAMIDAVCDAAEKMVTPLGVDWTVRYSRQTATIKLSAYVGHPTEVVAYHWPPMLYEVAARRELNALRGVQAVQRTVAQKVVVERAARAS